MRNFLAAASRPPALPPTVAWWTSSCNANPIARRAGFLDHRQWFFPSGTGIVHATLAGHPGALMFSAADGQTRQVGAGCMLLGVQEDATFQSEAVPFAAGDAIVLFTDGVSEASDPGRNQYGAARLEGQVKRHGQSTARTIAEEINADVSRHCQGQPMNDDYTVLVVKRV
ncbi:MAG: PP2C family protein-serine/threonine phosphatase [Planctomycetota bacterium]